MSTNQPSPASQPPSHLQGPTPGPGGPPTGIPRRKESMTNSPSADRIAGSFRESRGDERVGLWSESQLDSPSKHDEEGRGDTKSSISRTRYASDQHRVRKQSDRPHRPTRSLIAKLPSAKGVSPCPAGTMYYSPLPSYGTPPNQALRAHTGTVVDDRIWLLGGVDHKRCWRGVSCLDTETYQWTQIETIGETLPPLRAHSTTLVGEILYIFGGGDGPTYSNDVWTLDTVRCRFQKPHISTPRSGLPPPRRAHTAVLYRHFIVVFGGGNGQAALNDVWALDVSDPNRLSWQEWRTKGDVPHKKGYHSANLVNDKMIVFGGSDGHASFADVHVFNLQTLTWKLLTTEVKHNRLSHTSTQVGSYLFVIGGHNGNTYAQDILLFNLVTLQWEIKVPSGITPPGRGYHVALLHDTRIFVSGGYDGGAVFDDLWVLELGSSAYLPQVTTFEVEDSSPITT